MFQLRPYQDLLIEGVRDEFLRGLHNTCVVAPCGAGKTVIMAWMASKTAVRGNPVLFTVHRRELIDQASETFSSLGIQHGIIAPGCQMNNELIQIGSIFTVVKRLDKIQAPKMIFVDECFPAGTIVDGRPIEQLKAGDMATCFDEKTGEIKYSKITHIFKNRAPAVLVNLKFSGQSVVCTENHPVFTPDGWKTAKDIKEGDLVYVSMPPLRRRNEEQESAKMPCLLPERYDRAESQGGSRENDNQQSDEISRMPGKGSKHTEADQPLPESQRWQRQGTNSSTGNPGESAGLDMPGVRVANQNTAGNGISISLQDRHCKPEAHDCNRGRREFSQYPGPETTGQEEGNLLEVTRVDSVEVLKQGYSDKFKQVCSDGYVYNVEVEKYSTYFANGLAVHNCHHSTANTWRKLLAAFPGAYVIGLTATPARMSGEGLGDIFESLVIGPSVKQLIDWGNLAPFKYYAPPIKANLEGLRVRYGDYVQSDVSIRMDKSEIIGDTIEQYKKLADGKRAICYCVSRAHSEHTAEMFQQAGIPAMHIDGETNAAVRAAAIEQFRNDDIKVLCNVDLISEGFDVPAMEAVILCRPTQSLTLHIQQSMRPMRPDSDNPDKTAIIIDQVGNVYRHGLPDEDRIWSLEGKKKDKRQVREIALRQCPECYAAHRPAPVCPLCGFTYAAGERSEPTQRKGELVKIDEVERKHRRQEVGRARNITDLEQIALRRGYSLRWISKIAGIKNIPMEG